MELTNLGEPDRRASLISVENRRISSNVDRGQASRLRVVA
jgi:hypothetical protein